MKSPILWDIGWLYLLPSPCWCLAWPIIRPRRWRRRVHPKRLLNFKYYMALLSQKIGLFIIADVRSSNPTILKRIVKNVTIRNWIQFRRWTNLCDGLFRQRWRNNMDLLDPSTYLWVCIALPPNTAKTPISANMEIFQSSASDISNTSP
jgi:hypothetical protein